MAVNALGYIGIRSDKRQDWSDFAGKLLGMQEVDRGGKTQAFRMDDYKQRLVVSDEEGETLAFLGWEVETLDDLEIYAARLDAAGTAVTWGSRALADRRLVDALIWFHDPAGNRIEFAFNPMRTTEEFIPGRPIDGFKTGPYGMGHAVLHVPDATALVPFYRDILGFALSDFGLKPIPLYFFHVNGRHHSFAIVGSGASGFHHFMIEYKNLDDVGQGYDLALQEEDAIAYTLGRHTNDHMMSYYANTPSGFFVESGWAGRIIDPATWKPEQTDVGPSFWGHERLHLPEDRRAEFRKKRLETAARGFRAPPVIDCPWLYSQIAKS